MHRSHPVIRSGVCRVALNSVRSLGPVGHGPGSALRRAEPRRRPASAAHRGWCRGRDGCRDPRRAPPARGHGGEERIGVGEELVVAHRVVGIVEAAVGLGPGVLPMAQLLYGALPPPASPIATHRTGAHLRVVGEARERPAASPSGLVAQARAVRIRPGVLGPIPAQPAHPLGAALDASRQLVSRVHRWRPVRH